MNKLGEEIIKTCLDWRDAVLTYEKFRNTWHQQSDHNIKHELWETMKLHEEVKDGLLSKIALLADEYKIYEI